MFSIKVNIIVSSIISALNDIRGDYVTLLKNPCVKLQIIKVLHDFLRVSDITHIYCTIIKFVLFVVL